MQTKTTIPEKIALSGLWKTKFRVKLFGLDKSFMEADTRSHHLWDSIKLYSWFCTFSRFLFYTIQKPMISHIRNWLACKNWGRSLQTSKNKKSSVNHHIKFKKSCTLHRLVYSQQQNILHLRERTGLDSTGYIISNGIPAILYSCLEFKSKHEMYETAPPAILPFLHFWMTILSELLSFDVFL